MQIEDYRKVFPSIDTAFNRFERTKLVVEFLETNPEFMSCKEIRTGINNSNPLINDKPILWWVTNQMLGAILTSLTKNGFVERKEIDDGLVEIKTTITVMTDPGAPEWIPNPDYDPSDFWSDEEIPNPNYREPIYEERTITKTVHRKHKVYRWIGEN